MGNSIEEDIKNAEHFIKSIKIDKEYKEENGWHGYYNKEIVELARILQHILSDYKRVWKENEILKNKLLDTLKGQKAIEEETPQYVKENYISKEKIKDKIEALKNNPIKIKQNDKYYFETDAYNKIIQQVLQELLEGRK